MSTKSHPDTASPFADIKIGTIASRFGERVTRVVQAHRGDTRPAWFDPRQHTNHLGIHIGRFSVYMEIEVDNERRRETYASAEAATRISQSDIFALIDRE